MDKLDELELRIEDSWVTYRENILCSYIENVFEKSYETAIKYELKELSYEKLNEEQIDFLLKQDNILDFLYEEYLKNDSLNICNELNQLLEEIGDRI